MAVRYEIVTPSPIANATVERVFRDEVHKQYRITPNEGYVLHDKRYDEEVIDPDTLEPTGAIKLGYRTFPATCAASYDFVANPNEFYTVPANDVPADQIYGGDNNHEVM